MGLLTDELRARIGETAVYTAPEPVGRAAIRYYAMAVGDDNPLYTDAEAAHHAGYRDVIAPPTWVTETNQYMSGVRNHEGYMGHSWGIEVPNSRLVRGGNSYTFDNPVYPEDIITATWEIVDATERTTSKGQDMLIVTSQATYTNQHGALIGTNTETLIWTALS
ncbi:MAG TPA: hypothetical protein DHW34_02890 [Actinobacteria bacterium]|nr:hypothetical protein [Actinomycetota bacterium]